MNRGVVPRRVWWVATAMAAAVLLSVPAAWNWLCLPEQPEMLNRAQAEQWAAQPDPYDACSGPPDMRSTEPWPPLRKPVSAQVALASRPDLAPLLSWYKQWREIAGIQWEPSKAYLDSLNRQIRASSLTPLEMFDVASDLAQSHDLAVTCVWIRSATDLALTAIRSDGVVSDEDRYTVRAMAQSDPSLWRAMDGVTLEKQKSFLSRAPRENAWDQVPEWARIGNAEALWLQKRYSEALSQLGEIDMDMSLHAFSYTDRQRTEVHWARALILFDLHEYADAAAHLEVVASDTKHHHCAAALRDLVASYSRMGRVGQAEQRFKEWVRRSVPDQNTALCLMGEIVLARQRLAQNGHGTFATVPD